MHIPDFVLQAPPCRTIPTQVDPCLDSSNIATWTPLCQETTLQTTHCQAPLQITHCQEIPTQNSHIECPNSNLLYPLDSATTLPTSLANVLNPEGIANLLQQYPNQQFVEALIMIATSGV